MYICNVFKTVQQYIIYMKKYYILVIVFSFLGLDASFAQSFNYIGNFRNNEAGLLVSVSNRNSITNAEIWLHGKVHNGFCNEENGILKGYYEEDKVKKLFSLLRQNNKYYINVENYTYEVDLETDNDKQPTGLKLANVTNSIPKDVALPKGENVKCSLGNFEFTLPEKWKMEHKSDLCYKMTTTLDNTQWMVRAHTCTNADELYALLSHDILFEDSPQMTLTDGGLMLYGNNGLISTREGFTKTGERQKYTVVGMLSPDGGGVLVIGGAHKNDYPKDNAIAAKSIANSIIFKKNKDEGTQSTWYKLLNNRMLVSNTPGTDESLSLKNDGTFYYRNAAATPLKGVWSVHLEEKKVTLILAIDDQNSRIFTLEKVFNKAEVRLNNGAYQVRSLK